MTQVDQFESVFRAAVKEQFEYSAVEIKKVMVVTDKDKSATEVLAKKLEQYLSHILGDHDLSWVIVTGDQFETAEELKDLVEDSNPDLIMTYRNLHTKAWQFKFSLGTHLDVLLQAVNAPVLLIPHPDADYAAQHAFASTGRVMAVTDDLEADNNLVSRAIQFTVKDGTLFLVHIENEKVFERYINVISKISTIDTENARERIKEQLLKEPADYIESCIEQIKELDIPLVVESVVDMGQHVRKYKNLIEQNQIDLLVMNTKDSEQLAMHRIAYPLAIELREIPLLML